MRKKKKHCAKKSENVNKGKIKSNKTYLKFTYYNEKCNSIFQILVSKICFSIFDRFSSFFYKLSKNFLCPINLSKIKSSDNWCVNK